MKKIIKRLLYPIITEIFNELLFKQTHSTISYRVKDHKPEIVQNQFFEEILKNRTK